MQEAFDRSLARLLKAVGCDGRRPRVLAAVSGGVDSMVMANLLMRATPAVDLALAHMNFSLRGEESDADESFVREWCLRSGIKMYQRRVDARAEASLRGISVEMAARDLRYAWFEELLDSEGFDCVAVAHNLNDQIETVFLHLLRGGSLRSLAGMPAVRGRIIRPLLDAPRSDIEAFAAREGIDYRVDSTNRESVFARNRLRNEVFPHFAKINPSFVSTIAASLPRFAEAQAILDEMAAAKKADLCSQGDGFTGIDTAALKADPHCGYWLYAMLEGYGFRSAQVADIARALAGASSGRGQKFFSPTHLLVWDRDLLKLYPVNVLSSSGPQVRMEVHPVDEGFDPRKLPEGTLCVDAELVNLPLSCRPWQAGDRFRPFGMRQSRLLSDFFTDLKMDAVQKSRVRVVTTQTDGGEQIVCIAGLRIDDRFRLTESTRSALFISID